MNFNLLYFSIFCLFVVNISLIVLYVTEIQRKDQRIIQSVRQINAVMNDLSERMDSAIRVLQNDILQIQAEEREKPPASLPMPEEPARPAKRTRTKKNS